MRNSWHDESVMFCRCYTYSTILRALADSLRSCRMWFSERVTCNLSWRVSENPPTALFRRCTVCRLGACSVYTMQPCTSLQCHFIRSRTRRMPVCLAVTCHLHFWQNDRDLLRATAVTRGWVERLPKWESAQKVDPGEENSPAAPAGTRTRDFSITSPAL